MPDGRDTNLLARIEQLEAELAHMQAENERLRGLVPHPDQTRDEAAWVAHKRGVSIDQLAKEAGVTRERMRVQLNKFARLASD